MARQKPDEVQKELDQQEDENYGDETVSGTNPRPDADDDVEEIMEDAVGEDFNEEGPVDLAEEVEEDEEDIREDEINDYKPEPEEAPEVPEGELERIEKKENPSTDDPYNQVTDDDVEEEDDEE